jgi:hypothetical protein
VAGECVGSGSDPGEEAEAGPFGELGEDVAGLTVFVTGGDTLGQASRRMGDEPAHEIDCRHVMYDLAGSIGRRSLLVTFSASPVTSTSAAWLTLRNFVHGRQAPWRLAGCQGASIGVMTTRLAALASFRITRPVCAA